jgi:hypothetical protein
MLMWLVRLFLGTFYKWDYLLNPIWDKIPFRRQCSVTSSTTHRNWFLFNFSCPFVEVEVNLRPTVSRPVCLGVGHPSGTRDQFFFLLEIFFTQLRVCYFVAPFLTRGSVCNLLYNCQSSHSCVEVPQISGHILLSHLRLPNLEGQVPVFIFPRNRMAQLYPRALGCSFVLLVEGPYMKFFVCLGELTQSCVLYSLC